MSDATLTASGLDQIEQLISEQYLAVRLKTGQQDPTFTAKQTAVGPIVVGRAFYDMTLDMDADPMGTVAIIHCRGGVANYHSGGEEITWRQGDVSVSAIPTDAFTAAYDHFDCEFTIYDPRLLSDVAHPAPGDAGPVRLTGFPPVSERAAEH